MDTNGYNEKDYGIMIKMFNECLAELSEHENTEDMISKQYEKLTGVQYNSPLGFMFAAFVKGLEKGMELSELKPDEEK